MPPLVGDKAYPSGGIVETDWIHRAAHRERPHHRGARPLGPPRTRPNEHRDDDRGRHRWLPARRHRREASVRPTRRLHLGRAVRGPDRLGHPAQPDGTYHGVLTSPYDRVHFTG